MVMGKVNKNGSFGGHRFVTGPQNEAGYIAKKPGHGAATELMLMKRKENREKERKLALKKAEARRTLHKNNAEEKWALMDMKTTMDRIVDLGLRRADEELNEKRNRLKIALLEEESALMYEYTDKAQKVTEKVLNKNKQKVDEILERKVLSDRAYNEAINEKIALSKSETYAVHVKMENLKNAVEANRAQIQANIRRKAVEKDEEQIWEKIDQERVEEMSKVSNALSDLRREKQKFYRDSLNKQVEAGEMFRAKRKIADDFEDEILKKLQAENFEKYRDRLEREDRKRRQHYEDSKMQRTAIKDHRLTEENCDLKFEEILVDDVHRKFQLDASKQVSEKEQLKRELMSFQNSIRRYKQMHGKVEEDFDKVVSAETEKLRLAQNSIMRSEKIATKKRLDEIVFMNKWLAGEKLKRENAAKELDKIYHEFQLRDGEILNTIDKMLQLEYRKNYETAPTDLANAEYLKNLKLRQQIEENESERKNKAEIDEMEATVRGKLAERTDYSTRHPFYHKLTKF